MGKLTVTQKMGLRRIAEQANEKGWCKSGVVNRHTAKPLIAAGMIEESGLFAPLMYRLTDAGRAALEDLEGDDE